MVGTLDTAEHGGSCDQAARGLQPGETWGQSISGPHLKTKIVFPKYGDFHVKEKTVVRPSYL